MIFFRALPVTGSDRNPYQATISTFLYALKKRLGKYLVWGGRDWAPRFRSMKKNSSIRMRRLIMKNPFNSCDCWFGRKMPRAVGLRDTIGQFNKKSNGLLFARNFTSLGTKGKFYISFRSIYIHLKNII